MTFRAPLFLLLAALALPRPLSAQATTPVRVGDFQVSLWSADAGLAVRSARTDAVLMSTKPGLPFFSFAKAKERVSARLGSYDFDQDILETAAAREVLATTSAPDRLVATVRLEGPGGAPREATVEFSASGEGTLHVRASAAGEGFNRATFAFLAAPGEDYLGLGEQYNRVRHAGMRVPVWCAEQGIGRHDGPIRLPFTGRTTDSLFPMPYFLSTAGYGFLADTTARTVFDLGVAPRRDRVAVETWDGVGAFYLFDGPRPADVVTRLTRVTGRPRALPDWAFGVWLGVQGGPARIREALAHLGQAGAPVDAIWAQDWLGARSMPFGYDLFYKWTADEKLYPDLPGLISELHGRGLKFLGYFNSFIEPRFPEFTEAASRGFLVQGADGKPFTPLVSTFRCGLVDLSNPDAREYLAGFMRKAIRMGMDGWMADFGEWLPFDGRIRDEGGAPKYHNRYPVEWARLNRETFLSERPDGDFVVFNRSGFTGSSAVSDSVWAGDQNTSWGADDGLPSVVPAGLNLGLSGVPFYHFDAGGFTSLVSLPRGEELFMRWVEAAAMSPLLRTHEGYWRQRNVQVDSSPRVLAHFAKMAKLHKQLLPYLRRAAAEAVKDGLPVMRHLWLAYPDDPATLDLLDEYLLGPDLLAAPILKKGATEREVTFPAGSRWRHWTTGKTYEGPSRVKVAAPLGEPALFVRQP